MPDSELGFEWDEVKAKRNLAKHGIGFEEAASVFFDPLSITISDPDHSQPGEDRWITLGVSNLGKLLVVAHCDRGEVVRIISARSAIPSERRTYEEE